MHSPGIKAAIRIRIHRPDLLYKITKNKKKKKKITKNKMTLTELGKRG